MVLHKNLFLKNFAIYIIGTRNKKKIDWKFSSASKIGQVWSYLSQNIGLFQPRKVHKQMKKREKNSRSQENEVRRVFFFVKMLFFYSVNSNLAKNQSLKNHTL
jgi:hypothetical protein